MTTHASSDSNSVYIPSSHLVHLMPYTHQKYCVAYNNTTIVVFCLMQKLQQPSYYSLFLPPLDPAKTEGGDPYTSSSSFLLLYSVVSKTRAILYAYFFFSPPIITKLSPTADALCVIPSFRVTAAASQYFLYDAPKTGRKEMYSIYIYTCCSYRERNFWF